ncbi:type II toxin-antitoxin system VapB family antitoxin [Saccharomonospora iraqiensis]|uniref:type II toxin-antitoxin system VapB family antitoxin n=1 Tax=Saccharomonospora iraqiensis TaxID=52698 RepID=UPI00041F327E|nr:type II toxin-antitoxin system VapB family antitoxin [Saccharomonospora iraqiensis]
MSNVSFDIDDDALSEASELLGTNTAEETVNLALRETVLRLRRAQALAELAEAGAGGGADDLPHKDPHRG